MIFLVASYSVYTDWILRTVKIPADLALELPRLPLAWAAVIVLALLFFVVLEGGYRRLKAETQLKEKSENKQAQLEKDNQKLLCELAVAQQGLQNANAHFERLQNEIAELRRTFPRIEVIGCERAVTHLYEGLVVRNHGEPAFNIEILPVQVGSAILRTVRGVERLAKDDGERHMQFEIQNKSGGVESQKLFDFMRTQNIDAIDVLVVYKDWENHWYRTLCKIERDVLARGGLAFKHVSQERTKPPA